MPDVYGWIFFISGVIFFISIIGVFISVANERNKLLRCFGMIIVSLFFPLVIVFIGFLVIGAEWRIYVYIILIFAYLIVELLLDFILKTKFRDKPSSHVPYIILEYVACFAFIIISFEINAIMGWIISICFWAMLATLVYYIIIKKKKEKKL